MVLLNACRQQPVTAAFESRAGNCLFTSLGPKRSNWTVATRALRVRSSLVQAPVKSEQGSFWGKNCLSLVVYKLSYNHRESGLWEPTWTKMGKRALMQPRPSVATSPSGKVRAGQWMCRQLHRVSDPSWGLNHTLVDGHTYILTDTDIWTYWLIHIYRSPDMLTYTLIYRHTDIFAMLWHMDILAHALTHEHIDIFTLT